ncbi:unnamed protein product [Mytilus edulis]|uniref:Uncharacterized protein n=1 Tax=Mytilus edulis TaxID=6550 RepID=A0A8S3QC00_MYTED|nr:unnamed protein product [Mytilus edulis]
MLVLSKRNGTFKLFRVERYYGYESLVVECRKRIRNGMEADMNVVPKLRLGKTKIIWQVCTAPMRNDILIGLDLLKEVDSIIMTRQESLGIDNGGPDTDNRDIPDYTDSLPEYLGPIMDSTGDNLLSEKKKRGCKTIDYMKINAVTSKDSYPLPNIEECLDTLAGASVFSTLDLQSG